MTFSTPVSRQNNFAILRVRWDRPCALDGMSTRVFTGSTFSPGKPTARRANAQLVVEPVEEALGPQTERFRLDVQVGAFRRGEGDERLRAGQGVVEVLRLAGPELLALRIGDQQMHRLDQGLLLFRRERRRVEGMRLRGSSRTPAPARASRPRQRV